MPQNELIELGLTKTQAKILDFLMEEGEKKAREIARSIKQPRGAIYKSLSELIDLNLVEKVERKKDITKFRAQHPSHLEKLLDKKERTLEKNKLLLDDILPSLISRYNLGNNKPGIIFYEGIEGVDKILYDTLKSKTDIYLFLNFDSLSEEKNFYQIDQKYTKRRKQLGIRKKIIDIFSPDTQTAYAQMDTNYRKVTEIRYIDKNVIPFKTLLQIYDNKISYLTVEGDSIISILVEDRNIYSLHKAFFETIWDYLPSTN